MTLSDLLKREAHIMQHNSGIKGKEEFKFILKKLKNTYYNLSPQDKIKAQEEWNEHT